MTISRGYGLPVGEACCKSCRSDGVGIRHGKSSTYRRKGCRCELCREAHNLEMRAYAAHYRQKTGKGLHGVYRPDGYRSPTSRNWIPDADRAAVYSRDGLVCGICEVATDPGAHFNDDSYPTLDHIVPRSKGGSDDLSNLRCAHRICNSRRGNRELPLSGEQK